MLNVEHLGYSYGQNKVLTDFSMSANAGELVCLLGANGAGKTTLFRLILRRLDNYEGQILIDQVDIRRLSVRDLAKRLAYVPQATEPTFNYRVFETVLMGTNVLTSPLANPRQAENEIAASALEAMHISHLTNRGFTELSGGERQLVLIARALAQQSAMIVMDEPTANLDYGNQLRVMAQAKGLARQGHTVLLSTHNPQLALLYADQVVVLDGGRAVASGAPNAVLTPALIERIYGVVVELQTIATAWGPVPVLAPEVF